MKVWYPFESILTISSGLSTPNWTILMSRKGAGEPDTHAIALLQQDGRFDEVIFNETFSFFHLKLSLPGRLKRYNGLQSLSGRLIQFVLVWLHANFPSFFRRKSAKELSFFVPAERSAPKALLPARSLSPRIYSETPMCGAHRNSSGPDVALSESPSDVWVQTLFWG